MGLCHLITLGPFSREYGHSFLFSQISLEWVLFLVFWLSHEMSLTLIDGHPSLSLPVSGSKVIRSCVIWVIGVLVFCPTCHCVGLSQVLLPDPRFGFGFLCLFLLCLGLCLYFPQRG